MNHDAATVLATPATVATVLATPAAPVPHYDVIIPGPPKLPHDIEALLRVDPLSLTIRELGARRGGPAAGQRALDRAAALGIADMVAATLAESRDELVAAWRAEVTK